MCVCVCARESVWVGFEMALCQDAVMRTEGGEFFECEEEGSRSEAFTTSASGLYSNSQWP